MRVLVAPDKFKGTLSAVEAARAMAAGILDVDPEVTVDCCPMADGGEGSHEVALAAGFTELPVRVRGADGTEHVTTYAVRGATAVLELARLCGTPTLRSGPQPWTSTTFGLGQAIRAAVDRGAREIVLCIGGSASVDGGTGMLRALGWQFLAAGGSTVANGLVGLGDIATVRPPNRGVDAEVRVVCDVDSPLLGARGGIRQFSAQKGLDAEGVLEAERRSAHWAERTRLALSRDLTDTPGGGSAGGVGFAAIAYLGAELVQGVDFFEQLIDLSARVDRADLVFTGEGAFDKGSLDGKTPVGVARRARSVHKPCHLIAGRVEFDAGECHPFAGLWSLVDEVGETVALEDSGVAVRRVARRVFRSVTPVV